MLLDLESAQVRKLPGSPAVAKRSRRRFLPRAWEAARIKDCEARKKTADSGCTYRPERAATQRNRSR